MTMLIFSYDDGEDGATVTWTPDYGFVATGSRRILGCIRYEEREPKVVDVPVLQVPMRQDVPKTASSVTLAKCFACDHPWHVGECQRKVEGLPCGCSTAVA